MTGLINSILLVEDNRLIAFQLSQELKRNGYQITTAHSGGDAIRSASSCHPDLILMDINLNGEKDGIEIMHEIHDEEGFIPNIYITGYSESELVKRMKETSPVSILEKPLNSTALMKIIETQEIGG